MSNGAPPPPPGGNDPTVPPPGNYWGQAGTGGGGVVPPPPGGPLPGGQPPAAPPPRKRPVGLIITAVVLAVLLIGSGVTAGLLLLGSDGEPAAEESSDAPSEAATSVEPSSTEPTEEETASTEPTQETSAPPATTDPDIEVPPGQVVAQGTGYHLFLDDAWQEDTTTPPSGNVDLMMVLGGATIETGEANILTETAFVGTASQGEVLEQLRTNLGSGGTVEDTAAITLGGEFANGLSITGTNQHGIEVEQLGYLVVRDSHYFYVALTHPAGGTGNADFEAALSTWTWE